MDRKGGGMDIEYNDKNHLCTTMGWVYSTVRICPKSSSNKVTSLVMFVPTNNGRMSSEYIYHIASVACFGLLRT